MLPSKRELYKKGQSTNNAKVWMNFKKSKLTERNHRSSYMIPFLSNAQKRQVYRGRK
jgi:hypothetical protein